MSTNEWIDRVQLELKDLQSNNLPYFLDTKDVNYVPKEGKCIITFLVSLDDDISTDNGKLKLKRAASSRLITVTVDISMIMKPGASFSEASASYPFHEPKFTLKKGANFFPPSFNASDGDRLKYENKCWNSKLYVYDVIAHMATKIRSSIRSGNLSLVIEKDDGDNHSTCSSSSGDSTSSGNSGNSGSSGSSRGSRGSRGSSSSTKSTRKAILMNKLKRLKELRGFLSKSKEKDENSKGDKNDSQLKKLRGILRNVDGPETSTDDSSIESLDLDKDIDKVISIKDTLSLDAIAEEDEESVSSTIVTEKVKNSCEDYYYYHCGHATTRKERTYQNDKINNHRSNKFEFESTENKDDTEVNRNQKSKSSTEQCSSDLAVEDDRDEAYQRDIPSIEERDESLVRATNPNRVDEHIDAGKVIDLSQIPFDKAHGLFRCKMSRRPAFMTDQLQKEEILQNYLKEVQSKRDQIFQDDYIMLIDDKIVEIKRPNSFTLFANKAKVVVSISVLSLIKIEYCLKKRTLSLFFKEDIKDPLEYTTTNCAGIANMLSAVMKSLGINGKHRTPSMEIARKTALEICTQISSNQRALSIAPQIHEVKKIIMLYCLAAEKFEYALDDRRCGVVIQRLELFLTEPRIVQALANAVPKRVSSSSTRRSSTEKPTHSLDVNTSCYSDDHETENQYLYPLKMEAQLKQKSKGYNNQRAPLQRRIVC